VQVGIDRGQWAEQAEDGAFVSRASLWELAIKISLGKLRLDLPKFVRQAERDGFLWLSIDNSPSAGGRRASTFNDHNDPFDRLLVAQSMTEPLILIMLPWPPVWSCPRLGGAATHNRGGHDDNMSNIEARVRILRKCPGWYSFWVVD